ncbi:MAG: PIN domain-containing protein [Candidatus Micrarchaeota archaeon]
MKYYFDTYALLELVFGSSSYMPYYGKEFEVVTCDLNVAEAYFVLLRNGNIDIAEKLQDMMMEDALIPSKTALIEACRQKFSLRKLTKKDVSFVDALGYHLAKSMGLKFLTGDDAFRGLKNVKFVK